MAKDFRAAFSNMNQAVRPGGAGNVQPVASQQPAAPVEKKMTAIERRSKLHGVQTYLTDEEYEMLMIAKIRTKKKFEEILHDSLIEYIKNYQ